MVWLASPQTSFGARSSRKWMRDERTPKDVCGEAMVRLCHVTRAVDKQKMTAKESQLQCWLGGLVGGQLPRNLSWSCVCIFLFAAGYVGSKSFLEELLQVVHELRKANPNLVFGMHLMCLLLLSSVWLVPSRSSCSRFDWREGFSKLTCACVPFQIFIANRQRNK